MPVLRPRREGNGWAILGRLYLVAGFVFLLLPIVTLVAFSFQKNQYASLPGQGWSLRWYIKLFSDGVLLQALKNSLIVSPLAATGASIIGFFAAYAVNRFVFAGRTLLSVVLVLPILIPPLILGVAFLGLLSRLGLQGQLYSVLIAPLLPFLADSIIDYNHTIVTKPANNRF